MSEELNNNIVKIGERIRELKSAKAEPDAIQAAVSELLELKSQWKAVTGADWKPPATTTTAPNPAVAPQKSKSAATSSEVKSKDDKKTEQKVEKGNKAESAVAAGASSVPAYTAPKGITFYPCANNTSNNMKCLSLAAALAIQLPVDIGIAPSAPRTPVLSDKSGTVVRFGANAICRYLSEIASTGTSLPPADIDFLLDAEEAGSDVIEKVEARLLGKSPAICSSSALVNAVLYPALKGSSIRGPAGQAIVAAVEAAKGFSEVQKTLNGGIESLENFDYANAGLLNSLKLLFSHALLRAFPMAAFLEGGLQHAVITRCANPNFGDFQCNSAMALGKALKISCPNYTGKSIPLRLSRCRDLRFCNNRMKE